MAKSSHKELRESSRNHDRHRKSSRDRDRSRENKRESRKHHKKGSRKHHHRSNSSRSSYSESSHENDHKDAYKRKNRHQDRSRSRSPEHKYKSGGASSVKEVEEQKRMMRLAKARILANVQLQAEEQEQQALNQMAWQEAVQPEPSLNKGDADIFAVSAASVVTPLVQPKTDIVVVEEQPQKIGKFIEFVETTNAGFKPWKPSKFGEKPLLFTVKPTGQAAIKSNVLISKFTKAAPIQKTHEIVFDAVEDPLDAYMNTISADVVNQETFQPKRAKEEDEAEKTVESLNPDMIVGEEDLSFEPVDEEEDEAFHQRFMTEIMQKEQLERLQSSRGVNFEEDDEDFNSDKKSFFQGTEKFQPNPNTPLDQIEPIRKNLYIEAAEITKMTERQVKLFQKDSGDIKVRGLQCPRPIINWFHTGLPTSVLEVLQLKNFQKPFPIQCQAIPAIMSGRDLIGIAETGSGKTLAYLLPLIRHIRDQRPIAPSEGPIGLILAPTRELVQQIFKESRQLCKAVGIRVVAVYGGVSVQGQLSDLKRGTEIVVCTPGRMRDVLAASNGRITNLKRVSYCVLDEADRMLDMGFEPQIKHMLNLCRPDKQVVMFSATFPRSIESLAKSQLRTPLEVVVGNRGQTCTSVEQKVEVLQNNDEKLWKLIELLGEWYDRGSILIFVEKQTEADDLFKELHKIGYKALSLHGGMDQTDREFTIQDFKDRVRNILIATSVCARGLDIKHIQLVINYVCPSHLEDYVHRVGRTGRAGNKGYAVTFITPEECASAADLIRALESSQQTNPVPEALRDLDDLYQQKLQDGEIERRRSNIGFLGKGHKFTRDEDEKVRQQRQELAKSFGLALEESIDSDDENLSSAQLAMKQELNQLKHDHFQLVVMLERDPIAKKQAMEAGHRASIEAIKQGLSYDEATRLSREAMLFALQQYKPGVVSQDRAIQQVMKIRDQFIQQDNQRNSIFTEEIEINDLPQVIRAKVQSRDFLQSVTELCGSQVHLSVKGQYFESGKPTTGQRRLHLLVEAQSKQEAQQAAKEVKRNIEEVVAQNSSRGFGSVEFSGQFGKF